MSTWLAGFAPANLKVLLYTSVIRSDLTTTGF
jgi:hypothetical protein